MSDQKDDRLLTESEYEDFMQQCDQLSQAQELEDLQILSAVQAQKIEAQALYIKMLEDLNASRADKLLKLQENFEQLEKELIKLKCLK